ncbi:MAG: hypothetical protein LBC84_00465 [Prevotellaceae bacterium]|jgi:sugar lactone lactonase YvrE|nr:hypothetical protein [Prevotellaceae bacterium]
MPKSNKIILNALLFLLIAAFGYYVICSMMRENRPVLSDNKHLNTAFVSLYQETISFYTDSDIVCFDIFNNTIYAVLSKTISVFELNGRHLYDFSIETGVRDMVVEDTTIWLLYPTRLERFSLQGQKQGGWEACSPLCDYCALTTTQDYVYVTDAENKNIVQYDKLGGLVRFIKSPQGFIIPSTSFDVININDTLYCANSGRHQIESYTLEGAFIAAFGVAGAEEGAFMGCCNPSYLAKSADGSLLTSEKGNPRISCYKRDGTFCTTLFDAKALGEGTTAYRLTVWGESIYIAHKKTITKYEIP